VVGVRGKGWGLPGQQLIGFRTPKEQRRGGGKAREGVVTGLPWRLCHNRQHSPRGAW
jgi:hypothetical protein